MTNKSDGILAFLGRMAPVLAVIVTVVTFYIQQSIVASFQSELIRKQKLEEVLRGTVVERIREVKSGIEVERTDPSRYLDSVYVFTHDRHEYPFGWDNYRLLHRNVVIPIAVYGDETLKKKAQLFFDKAAETFRFVNGEPSQKGFGDLFQRKTLSAVADFNSTTPCPTSADARRHEAC